MRRTILLANGDMNYQGGTQAWIRQMYRSLGREHDVAVFSASGPVEGYPAYRPEAVYDVGLINHWPAAQALRKAHIRTRLVTVHGVIPFEETPVLGVDGYVAVSEAVQQKIPYPSSLIRNPIDFEHFVPDRVPRQSSRPERVAFVSNRQGAARPIIEEACRLMGAELKVVGRETAVADPVGIYRWADVVIGIARVAMEAAATGRNVVCFDYQGCHGPMTAESLPLLQRSNYGGHKPGTWPSPEAFTELVAHHYDPTRNLRGDLAIHHREDLVAQRYLDLADRTRPSRLSSLIRRGPRQLMSPKITRTVNALRWPRLILDSPNKSSMQVSR